jgi:hypothetical protein
MADVVVFTRGDHEAELTRRDAVDVRDWATEGPDEQALHRKIQNALEQEEGSAIAVTDDDLFAIRSALIRVLGVIEEKSHPLTPAQQKLREMAQGPPLP